MNTPKGKSTINRLGRLAPLMAAAAMAMPGCSKDTRVQVEQVYAVQQAALTSSNCTRIEMYGDDLLCSNGPGIDKVTNILSATPGTMQSVPGGENLGAPAIAPGGKKVYAAKINAKDGLDLMNCDITSTGITNCTLEYEDAISNFGSLHSTTFIDGKYSTVEGNIWTYSNGQWTDKGDIDGCEGAKPDGKYFQIWSVKAIPGQPGHFVASCFETFSQTAFSYFMTFDPTTGKLKKDSGDINKGNFQTPCELTAGANNTIYIPGADGVISFESGSIIQSCADGNLYVYNLGTPPIDTDAGTTDAGTTDAGTTDTGSTDTGSTDTGTEDAGSTDTGAEDTGSTDTGTEDAGSTDTGSTDTGTEDAGSTDTGSTDTGAEDTGSTDTGTEDAGSTDTGSTDTGSTDTGSTDTGSTDTGTEDAGQPSGDPCETLIKTVKGNCIAVAVDDDCVLEGESGACDVELVDGGKINFPKPAQGEFGFVGREPRPLQPTAFVNSAQVSLNGQAATVNNVPQVVAGNPFETAFVLNGYNGADLMGTTVEMTEKGVKITAGNAATNAFEICDGVASGVKIELGKGESTTKIPCETAGGDDTTPETDTGSTQGGSDTGTVSNTPGGGGCSSTSGKPVSAAGWLALLGAAGAALFRRRNRKTA